MTLLSALVTTAILLGAILGVLVLVGRKDRARDDADFWQ